MPEMNKDLQRALEVVRNGGVICYPTDTIWGLGCDATNPEAVARIYEIKRRADHKSMLVLLDHEGKLGQYVHEVPEIAWELIAVNDRPMTLIYPGAKNLADNLVAEDGSVGIRITSDVFCQKLIASLRRPLVSTSANITGNPSPAHFGEISREVLDLVDYVVEWRQDERKTAQASSILKLGLGGEIEIIRK